MVIINLKYATHLYNAIKIPLIKIAAIMNEKQNNNKIRDNIPLLTVY